MKNAWIKLGCFLTGYNYRILSGCSESAARRVKSYTSAMLIICILWSFIGYTFTSRYLKTEWYFSLTGALIMIIIVIQIERQVILSPKGSRGPIIFRLIIALTMAIIGSVIIDQILFKEDIEHQKTIMMGEKIQKVFPLRAAELKRQIHETDSIILGKENERKMLVDDLSKNPTIPVYTRKVTSEDKDSLKTEVITRTSSQIQNPKIALLQPLDDQIKGLRIIKIKKDSMLLELRPAIEAELRQNVGFLDELEVMRSILSESDVALYAWIVWFTFLLGIEGFILVSKLREHETDYDIMLKQQMELHYKRIELLSKPENKIQRFNNSPEASIVRMVRHPES